MDEKDRNTDVPDEEAMMLTPFWERIMQLSADDNVVQGLLMGSEEFARTFIGGRAVNQPQEFD